MCRLGEPLAIGVSIGFRRSKLASRLRWSGVGRRRLSRLTRTRAAATVPRIHGVQWRNSVARYESILGTVGNTPVVRINRLAPAGVNLFVKVEAFNPLGSVKDRLALGVIEAAEKAGELKPGQTVIEATSGNTGIGLA